jgi:hypothetical protein
MNTNLTFVIGRNGSHNTLDHQTCWRAPRRRRRSHCQLHRRRPRKAQRQRQARPPKSPNRHHRYLPPLFSPLGFLEKQAAPFMKELWNMLLEAQNSPNGIVTLLSLYNLPASFSHHRKKERSQISKRQSDGRT